MKKVAIILSGCGQKDGSEIHETTLTLLALAQNGAIYHGFAPNAPQEKVFDHYSQKVMPETRNILIESARLMRGAVSPIESAKVEEWDAAIFPGGYGAATNLCNFATHGTHMEIRPEVHRFANAMHLAKKPLGFICIAPVMISKICGPLIQQTIGIDPSVREKIEEMGGIHIDCTANQIIVDLKNKVVSTPAYMLARNISEAYEGISMLVKTVLEMCSDQTVSRGTTTTASETNPKLGISIS